MIEKHPIGPFNLKYGKALILGSFPPLESYKGLPFFFYQSPRNQFWKIIDEIFKANLYLGDLSDIRELQKNIKKKKEFCKKHCIAMADIGKKLKRIKKSASDSDLRVVEYFDIKMMVKGTRIGAVLCTSRYVYDFVSKLDLNIPVEKLMSPSPRYAKPLKFKINNYKEIFSQLVLNNQGNLDRL